MFASVPLNMPQDIHSANLVILFEGEVTERSIIEVYAPGDETGWAVVYKPSVDGKHTGETELIWGRWGLVREGHEFSRAASKAKRLRGEEQLVDSSTDREASVFNLGIEPEDEIPPEPTDAETFGDMPREDFGDTLEDAMEITVTDHGKLSGVAIKGTDEADFAFGMTDDDDIAPAAYPDEYA